MSGENTRIFTRSQHVKITREDFFELCKRANVGVAEFLTGVWRNKK